MRIPRRMYDEMLEHARVEAPNECCGLIGGRDGELITLYRAENSEGSPLRYNLDPQDQFRIMREMEESGEELPRSTTRTPTAPPIPRRPTSTSPSIRTPSI